MLDTGWIAPARAVAVRTGSAEREQLARPVRQTRDLAELFDLVFNTEAINAETDGRDGETAVVSERSARARIPLHAAEQQLQFQMRMRLAR